MPPDEVPGRCAVAARPFDCLLRQALRTGLCGWLRERGHDALHVFEADMIAASDETIAARAEADGSVLVSKDEDFVTLRLPDRFAFLWLRCGNVTNRALATWLEARWDEIETLLEEGERFVEAR